MRLDGHAGFGRRRADPLAQGGGLGFELRIKIGRVHDLGQGSDPGGHGQRIPRQGPRLIHRPGRRNAGHDVLSAAIGADRQPAADYFAETDQIRLDAETGLGAAERHPEPGHHFIENQQNAIVRRQFPHFLQIAVLRQHHAHIARHRFDNDRSD